jgi:hypothetical protein
VGYQLGHRRCQFIDTPNSIPNVPSPLTETALKADKPAEKAFQLVDGRGLFLFVPPSGARLWRMKYRYVGREKLLAIGE